MSLSEFYPKGNMTSKNITVLGDTGDYRKCKKVIETMKKFKWYLDGDSEYTYYDNYGSSTFEARDVKLYFRRDEYIVKKAEKLEKECMSFMEGTSVVWLDTNKKKEYESQDVDLKKKIEKLEQEQEPLRESLRKIEKYKSKMTLLWLLLIPSLLTIIIPFLGFYWIKFLINKIKELITLKKQESIIREKKDDITQKIKKLNGAAGEKMKTDLMSKVRQLGALYGSFISYDDFIHYVCYFRSDSVKFI